MIHLSSISLLVTVGMLLTVVCWSLTAHAGDVPAAPATVPSNKDDLAYDEKVHLLRLPWHGPGYHTRIAEGAMTHPTRDSMDYALRLLERGDPASADRASLIIAAVLPLQDVDPKSDSYGTWPWLFEEPVIQMQPPDMNWAVFIGGRLIEMLAHRERLTPDLCQQMRASLRHACASIVKRNVAPSYTNIAIAGAGVVCAVGEDLDDPTLLAWGRNALQRVLDDTRSNGGFAEYNSPTYTIVAMQELERAQRLVHDLKARQSAESLREIAWDTIATHFHPGTQQWAGPHNRTYHDLLDAGQRRFLADRTGVAIGGVTPAQPTRDAQTACPEALVERFKRLPRDPQEVISPFRSGDVRTGVIGTTWLTEGACLGSVNHSELWTQRRPLIGYWRGVSTPAGDSSVAVLRLRFLKDGRDFASAWIVSAQHGPRVLSTISFAPRLGDFHVSLDRPKDEKFTASDLRVRLELSGGGAKAKQVSPGVFELACGAWRCVVHVAPQSLGRDATPMQWEVNGLSAQEATALDQAWVDGVYHRGAPADLDLRQRVAPFAAIGLELLSSTDSASEATPELKSNGEASWPIQPALTAVAP